MQMHVQEVCHVTPCKACPKYRLVIVAGISECQAACRETCLCSQAREIKHVPVRCCKTFVAKAKGCYSSFFIVIQ